MAAHRARGLTNGYLPEAAFLHLAPTAVGYVELDEPLELRQAESSSAPAECRDALLMVRIHDEPLAIIHTYEPLEHASAASLAVAIWDQCAEEIRVHCERYGCCSPPERAEDLLDGLAARSTPCPGSQRRAGGASVTVVIPTGGRPRKLERCLESLCALDYEDDFDVIVVDNRPERPGTEEAVAAFADRLNVRYVAEPLPGSSVARNRGVAETAAELVAYADDDVVLDRGWLGWLLDPFADPRVRASAGMILPLELQTESQKRLEQYAGFSKGVTGRTYDLAEHRARDRVLYPYWGGVFGSGASVAFRRAEFVSRGGFDTALGAGSPARAGADIDAFTTVILGGGQVVYQPRAVSWHEHKRDPDALRRTLFDYGVGFTAVLTKYLLRDVRFQTALLRSVPLVLRRGRGSDNSARLPRALAWVERWGMVRGPRLYARSRRWARALHLGDVIEQP
jgi:cellulose synthase/poly-beta-1,6-N-acetylglucosamine synthase-like glycosyltransferase